MRDGTEPRTDVDHPFDDDEITTTVFVRISLDEVLGPTTNHGEHDDHDRS
jgi:hypothetical protein